MSGARLLTTAVHQLARTAGPHALCTLCVGVGQGLSMVLERPWPGWRLVAPLGVAGNGSHREIKFGERRYVATLARMTQVTCLLDRARHGDPKAAEELLPLVYDELRKLAAHRMASEPAGQTLQPTALVHEAWLKLAGTGPQAWNSRGHFFGAAAEAMRRILIDRARQRQARRHGGGIERVDVNAVELVAPHSDERLLAVNEALQRFETVDRAAAELVKLRCFVGLNMPEAAEALNLPLRSAERLWAYARAWLQREIGASFD